ncbi:uncharacterized protein LOC109704866 [Ananas comosus]|uniref:Uncharacterized protein LOC109704866 n=1 Tax=Ananas comosus TaxID=4615 RepID=A0A6P5ECV9_ANACO|nr:uncharacterized protein LOC109704866 [Ananas comosus]
MAYQWSCSALVDIVAAPNQAFPYPAPRCQEDQTSPTRYAGYPGLCPFFPPHHLFSPHQTYRNPRNRPSHSSSSAVAPEGVGTQRRGGGGVGRGVRRPLPGCAWARSPAVLGEESGVLKVRNEEKEKLFMDLKIIKRLLDWPRGSRQYLEGVGGFLDFAFRNPICSESKIWCPCVKCVNRSKLAWFYVKDGTLMSLREMDLAPWKARSIANLIEVLKT